MASDFVQDGAVIWTTLLEPGRGASWAQSRRRALTVVLLSTLLSLLATGVILPRLDAEAVAAATLAPEMTPHERTQAIEHALRLLQVGAWAQAAVMPVASAFFFAVVLYIAFWTAGAKTAFKPTFTVAAHALLPSALKAVLTAPAAVARAPVAPDQLSSLLPSSLAALAPASLPPTALAAASAFDLFTLWTFVLAGAGMMSASGASRWRTGAVLVVLFLAYVALFKVVPAGAAAGAGGP